ncbi:MAG: tetratricopeptide repeat protein [Acidobacteriota bacterium]
MLKWEDRYATRLISKGYFGAVILGTAVGCLVTLFMGIHIYLAVPLAVLLSILMNRWLADLHSTDEEEGLKEFAKEDAALNELIADAISSIPGTVQGLVYIESEVYDMLMQQAAAYLLCSSKFVRYMAAASVASWAEQDRKAMDALRLALEVEPDNLVAKVRMAESFEYLGERQKAIGIYQEALSSLQNPSMGLRAFLSGQVDRVRVYGPKHRPTGGGLRYMSY